MLQLVKRQQIVGSLSPPPGVTPNFQNPESNARTCVIASIVCVIIAALFVLARLWSKLFIVRSPGWDDVTSVTALACSATLSALNLVSVDNYGLGNHLWEVPSTKFIPFLKYSYAQAIVYGFGIYWAKMTILLLYLWLFGVEQSFRRCTYAVIALWSVWVICDMCLCIFECLPVQKAWDPVVPGHCISIIQVGIAVGYMNIFTDVLVLLLPVPLVWRLQLSTRLKLAVIGVFMIGAFACVASIIRQVQVVKTLHNPDATWHNSNSLFWLVIELNIGIVCGCMPTLRPLFRKVSCIKSSRSDPSSTRIGNREHRSHDSMPKTSSLARTNPSTIIDGGYIELGPTQNNNNRVQVTVDKTDNGQMWPIGHETAIMKSQTFGTRISRESLEHEFSPPGFE